MRSTANLFGLPGFYQYGLGSAGFGAWRELAAHIMATNWVLSDEVAVHAGHVLVRDTKQEDTGPVLRFTPAAWRRFARELKDR